MSSQQKSPEPGPSRLAHSIPSPRREILSSSDEDAVVVVKRRKTNVKRTRIIISDDDMGACSSNVVTNSETAIENISPEINDKANTGIVSVTDDVITSYYNVAVRQCDFATLEPGQFIRDGIIAFCFEYLQHDVFPNNKEMLFLSPTIVHHLKLTTNSYETLRHINTQTKQFTFLPVNDSESECDMGSHWFLLVFSRPDKRCYALDSSFKPEFVSKMHSVYERFNDLLDMGPTLFENFNCLKQQNSFDCGVHVIANAQNIAQQINDRNTCHSMSSLHPNQLISKRDEIAATILKMSSDVVTQQSNNSVRRTGTINSMVQAQQPSTVQKSNMPKKRPIPSSSSDDENVEIAALLQPKRANRSDDSHVIVRNNRSKGKSDPQPSPSASTRTEEEPSTSKATNKPHTADTSGPPKKRAGKYTKKKNKHNKSFYSIKCSLNSIVSTDHPNANLIVQAIDELVIRSTKVCFIAALMVLHMVNTKFDEARRTRNWSFFNTDKAIHFIVECFKAVTQSSRRNDHPFMTMNFKSIMNVYGIAVENTSVMNNIFKHITQQYTINLKNNIVVHAKVRLKALLTLKMVQRNGGIPNAAMKKTINNTINFMFNPKSRCSKDQDLIDFIVWYIPNPDDIAIGCTKTRGFMSLCVKVQWFAFVPLFMRIQREIAAHHRDCRRNGTIIRVRNFKVVPLHTHRRKHIKIDSVTLKRIMEHLKIHPSKLNPKTGRMNILSDAEFISARVKDVLDPNREYNPHWFSFLHWNKIKQMERKSKEFHYEIVTDGVSVSTSFQRKREESPPESFEELLEKQAQKYRQFGRNLANNLYDLIIGIDPGYKLFIAAIIKNVRSNEETHVKVSSKRFYSMTRQNYRDKKSKKWTDKYETAAKLDRENINEYDEYPSSVTPQYMNFIKHSMKFFKQGIELYTTRKYTRLHLDQYIRTQQAMDSIVHTLTDSFGSGRILVCIEGKPFNESNPIRKYRRCPGIRKLFNYLRKVLTCDIMFVDEYNTSKVCGCCQRKFDQPKHKQWDSKKIRHRVCDDCRPIENIISLPQKIIAPKSQRQLQMEHRERRHFIYQNNANVSWTEAYVLAKTPHQMHNQFQKFPFDPAIHKPIQKLVWNRDISAARNMIVKGICTITMKPLPPNLSRAIINNDGTDTDEDS